MVNKHATRWFLRFTLLALWCVAGVARGASAPVISSFAPTSGAPGTSVIISGANFSGATQVRFNTVDAIFEVLSASQIAVTVPVDALSGVISVATPGGTRSSSGSFVVTPRITSFTPTTGLAGATVIISGANFINGATTVQFNGVTASATVTAESQINATVPVGATNGFITVTTTAGGATSIAAFIVSAAPVITDFSPTIAKYGSPVVISGINFVVGGTTVSFNGTNAPGVSYTGQNGTQIQVNVPTGATTGPITVTTTNGTFTTSTNFVTGAGPIITGFSPIVGTPGTQVVITGINFTGATLLTFSNNVAAGGTITADTQIIATVPSGAVTGPISVTRNGITGKSTNNFHTGSEPIITEVTPPDGAVGAAISISGANLGGTTVIKFNGVTAGNVVVTGGGGTQISVPVPAGATTGFITAGNSAGTNSSPTPFVVTGPGPYITGFAPTSGPVGTDVVIEGGNFVVNGTGVSFNGVAAIFGFVSSSTQIHVTVPEGATTGPITVTTVSGTATTTSKFFVWPRITGFTPAVGVVGTSVGITGANFTNATAVQFNGTAASFTVNSGTNLTATVPADAITGTLSVTTPAGIVASTTNFFVPPKIDSFTPAAGAVGTNVLISGSAFLGATTVKFNGTAAVFSIVSRRLIVAVVPASASSGPITVTTSDGTATSANSFKILPSISGFSPVAGAAGAAVVITGTSFSGVTGVYFNGESAGFTVNAPSQITATVPLLATPGRIGLATADGTTTSATDFQVLPILYIGPYSGQDILIGWPTWATNFVVEATTNLTPTVVWTTVTNTPTVVGGENLITTNAASGKKFYRMRKP